MTLRHGRTTEEWIEDGDRLFIGRGATWGELSAWAMATTSPTRMTTDPALRRRLIRLRHTVRRLLRERNTRPGAPGRPPCTCCPTHCPVVEPEPPLARVTGRLAEIRRTAQRGA